MPVIALPPDSTPRAYLDYQVGGHVHTLLVRTVEGATDAEVSDDIEEVIEAVQPLLLATVFVAFRRAAEGSNVSLPATWGGSTNWGTGTAEESQTADFYSFTGRDVTGHKVRYDFFGRSVPVNDDYRIPAGDDTSVAATIAAIQSTEAAFLTIGGRTPLVNGYANMGVSGYWQRQLRK